MRTRSIRRAAMAATATGVLMTARRVGAERADRRFMRVDTHDHTVHEVGAARFRLPAAYQRSDGLVAYVAADLEAVSALLPSPLLHPVRLDRTHAMIGVIATGHFEIAARDPDGSTILLPPYGELGVFAAVTRRRLPPFVPLLLAWAADVPMGGFLLQLPVTSRIHRDVGRAIYGMPKFLADMEFGEDGPSRDVHVSEGGRTILDLRVEVGGHARLTRAPNIMYSVLDGRLIETVAESRAFVQIGFRARGGLKLGDHPVTDELQKLRLSERPLAAGIIQQQRFLLPAGRDIGPARERSWYQGTDEEFARFATRYADGSLVDHHAADRGQREAQPRGGAAETASG